MLVRIVDADMLRCSSNEWSLALHKREALLSTANSRAWQVVLPHLGIPSVVTGACLHA